MIKLNNYKINYLSIKYYLINRINRIVFYLTEPYFKHSGGLFLFLFFVTVLYSSAAVPADAADETNIGVTIVVRSEITPEGGMHREVTAPDIRGVVEFARNEFFGTEDVLENDSQESHENRIFSLKEEKLEDGTIRLTKDFEDAEDCAGILMDIKDLYFTSRYQLKQSVPQHPGRGIIDSIKTRFEFKLPSPVIKIQRDKKNLARQYGRSTVNEFVLDAQSNMDLFYQFNNYGAMAPVFIFLAGIFIAARTGRRYDRILIPVLAIAVSFIFAGAVILLIGESPFAALGAIFKGSLGSVTAVLNSLLSATPLVFTGLAVALAFNCGLFNIGGESQLMVGAFAAAVCGYYLNFHPIVQIPLTLFSAALAAGFFAAIAGWLKTRFDIHEVISTIMLNYSAYALLGYLVLLPCFKENGPNPQTGEIMPGSVLAPFFQRHDLNYGLIIALAAVFFTWFLLYKTTFGFNIRSAGLNPAAAEYSGVKVSRTVILTMFLSGALAGLGGAERVMGVFSKYNSSAFVGYGFDGIAVALLVNNNPPGVLFSALLFGILKTGGSFMNREIGVPVELVIIVQAVIIFFMAADKIVKKILKLKE